MDFAVGVTCVAAGVLGVVLAVGLVVFLAQRRRIESIEETVRNLGTEVARLAGRVQVVEQTAPVAAPARHADATTPAPTTTAVPIASAEAVPDAPPVAVPIAPADAPAHARIPAAATAHAFAPEAPDVAPPALVSESEAPHAAPRAARPPAWIAATPPPPPLAADPLPDEMRSPQPAGPGLERFLGGRVLLVVGVVAVLFGIGLVLKIAIEEGWIGPELRVGLGAAAGLAAIWFGSRLRSRGYDVFGQALMGGGVGALYLCDYFASVRYGFFERRVAFAVAGSLTAYAVVLGARRNLPFLAWLGFGGAFLAPVLLGRNQDALEGLTGWLVVVDLGVAAALVRRPWPGLDVFASLATMGYFVAWRTAHLRDARTGAAAACLGLLTAVCVVAALAPAAIARRRTLASSFAAAGATLLVAIVSANEMFFPAHRDALAAAMFGAAALVAALGVLHRRRVEGDAPDAEVAFGLALAVVAAAVPILFRGHGVTPAWAALGAACVHAGGRLRRDWLVSAGFVAIVLSGTKALIERAAPGVGGADAVFGAGFVEALAPCAALAVAAWSLHRAGPERAPASAPSLVAAAWSVVALMAHETLRTFSKASGGSTATAILATTSVVGAFVVAYAVATRGRARLTAAVWGPLVLLVALGVAALIEPREDEWQVLLSELFAAGWMVVAVLAATAFLGFRPPDLVAATGAAYLFALVSLEWLVWAHRGGGSEWSRGDQYFRATTALSVTWAAYAVAAVWGGLRFRRRWPVGVGIVVLALAAAAALIPRLGFDRTSALRPFGVWFALGLAPAAGAAALAWLSRRVSETWSPGVRALLGPVPAVVFVLAVVSLEILAWGERGTLEGVEREDVRFRAQVALSISWAVSGAALVAVGFRRRDAALRWTGLLVFLLTVAKVFLVDLARLDLWYRVGSFLALGVLLVAASFLYQRRSQGSDAN